MLKEIHQDPCEGMLGHKESEHVFLLSQQSTRNEEGDAKRHSGKGKRQGVCAVGLAGFLQIISNRASHWDIWYTHP